MSPIARFAYDAGAVTDADRQAAREWLRDFRAALDPDVLGWVDAMCSIRDYDPAPWRTWQVFLDSLGPNRRARLAERGVPGLAEGAPRP